MGILDFFRRKKKIQVSIDIHVADEKPGTSDKSGEAWGELQEFNYTTVSSLQSRFFAFDVETTGLSPEFHRIVELGVVEFVDGIPTRRFDTLVNPGVPIPADASAVNHITNEMIAGAPSERAVFPKLIDFLGDALQGKTLLCAHNARFDIDFLCNTLSRLGYDARIAYVDTLILSRRQIKGLVNYKQDTVASHFGIVNQNAHRAQSDAETCGKILVRLLESQEEALEQERIRLESFIPSKEELEVCAVIQSAIARDSNADLSYLRYKKSGSYVNVNCFYTVCRFKFSRKGKYVVALKSVAESSGLPIEPCTASEGGAGLLRVYFNDPFSLEPLFDFFCDQYQKKYIETFEYMSENASCKQFVIECLREGKQLKPDEMQELLASARAKTYEELCVQLEKPITREDVVICAENNRCPLSAIRNFNNWDAGFREGSPYYFEGEEKRKAGQYEEAIRLFDQARFNGYEAPALYDSYAKAYRQLKDYSNEIVIIEEFLSRNTYGRENEYKTRRDSALKLLYNKQKAEEKAVQKAIEKENRQIAKENRTAKAVTQKKPLGRPVLKLDDEGSVITEYVSISAAVADTGISSKSIRDAANGVQKHAGGFCWKYKDQLGDSST